jgi:hypothetical protein
MDLPRGRYGGGRRDFFLHSLGLVPYLYGAVPTSIGVKCVHAHYAAPLPARKRTDHANRRLGQTLAFVAGAANAGGFLAVENTLRI